MSFNKDYFDKTKRLAELMNEEVKIVYPYIWLNVHTQWNPRKDNDQFIKIIEKLKPIMIPEDDGWLIIYGDTRIKDKVLKRGVIDCIIEEDAKIQEQNRQQSARNN